MYMYACSSEVIFVFGGAWFANALGQSRYFERLAMAVGVRVCHGVECLFQTQRPQGQDVRADGDSRLPQFESAEGIAIDPRLGCQFDNGELAAGSCQPDTMTQLFDPLRNDLGEDRKFAHLIRPY